MLANSDFELRDFLYLDTTKVRSFASVIHGGLATEVSERIKQLGDLSGGIKVGAFQVGASLDVSKGREHEREQTMEITDPVLFDGLYRTLKEDKLKMIPKGKRIPPETFKINAFVQIEGSVRPPILESWIEQLRNMLDLLKKYTNMVDIGARGQQSSSGSRNKKQTSANIGGATLKQFEAIVELMSDYIQFSRQDPGKEYIRLTPEGGGYHVWCGLLPEYFVAPRADFQSQVVIVGQLERLLREEEEWKLVDLSRFGDKQTAEALIDAVNSLPMGQIPISENDLIARYPDIFIRPIAIFR
jgi:hypothetical protein